MSNSYPFFMTIFALQSQWFALRGQPIEGEKL